MNIVVYPTSVSRVKTFEAQTLCRNLYSFSLPQIKLKVSLPSSQHHVNGSCPKSD